MKHTVNIPFTENRHFFINYLGRKLTERKEICARELQRVLIKLNSEEGKTPKLSEIDLEENLNAPILREESEFFKNIRLQIEKSGITKIDGGYSTGK